MKDNRKQNVKTLGDQEYVVEQSRTVPDGQHTGEIQKAELVERGEEGFRYLDVYVVDDESEVVIKAGYAASRITPETDLGRLLARFGAPVTVDAKVRPVATMNRPGLKVAFETDTEKNANGRFARVILNTLRPQ